MGTLEGVEVVEEMRAALGHVKTEARWDSDVELVLIDVDW